MKIFILFFLFVITAIFSLQVHHKYDDELLDEVNKIISISSDQIENEFNVKIMGSGAGMPSNVLEKINLSFRVERSMSKAEIKQMLTAMAKKVVKISTERQIVIKYTQAAKFSLDNVSIYLFFYTPKGGEYYHPQYCYAHLSQGFFSFRTLEEGAEYRNKTSEQEPFIENDLK